MREILIRNVFAVIEKRNLKDNTYLMFHLEIKIALVEIELNGAVNFKRVTKFRVWRDAKLMTDTDHSDYYGCRVFVGPILKDKKEEYTYTTTDDEYRWTVKEIEEHGMRRRP